MLQAYIMPGFAHMPPQLNLPQELTSLAQYASESICEKAYRGADTAGMRIFGAPWLSQFECTLLCRVAQVLAEHMRVPVVRSKMILEGGSVHTDGEGCVL